MKGFFSGFVQKRIKPISSGTVKIGKNQAEKNALEKIANLDCCLCILIKSANPSQNTGSRSI